MISEPELEGEWSSDRPAELARPPAPGERLRGPRAPWLWALGGAVLASAVWAGALVVRERYADAGPPIAYRHAEDLCKEEPLKALGGLAGGFESGRPIHGESPAPDWSYCELDTQTSGVSYHAQLLVELHKKTDPEPEFGAGPGFDVGGGRALVEVRQVPGLGERALFFPHIVVPRLQVVDGGAVFTLTAQTWADDGEPEPDEDAVTAAMIEDMRVLMARLRK
ncbi:hypothetical protein ACWDYJ_05300 [Streptomyces sp. NPDC003042]